MPVFDRAVLKSLLARLEAAAGGDRQLDAAITVALFSDVAIPEGTDSEAGCYWLRVGGGLSLHPAERLTSSADAAVALFDQVMPSRFIRIDRATDRPSATLWRCETDPVILPAWAPTAALAILVVLLRALLAAATD